MLNLEELFWDVDSSHMTSRGAKGGRNGALSPKLTLYCTLITCVAIAEMPCAAGNRNWHNVGHMGLQRAGLTASPS
jgi:hypothetical protein